MLRCLATSTPGVPNKGKGVAAALRPLAACGPPGGTTAASSGQVRSFAPCELGNGWDDFTLLWKPPFSLSFGVLSEERKSHPIVSEIFRERSAQAGCEGCAVASDQRQPHFRQAVSNCALILATNNETKELLEAAGARKLFLDGGVAEEWLAGPPLSEVKRNIRIALVWQA